MGQRWRHDPSGRCPQGGCKVYMLSKAQERILHDLMNRKGREKRGMFLIEGKKFVKEAGTAVEFSFTPRDTNQFREYITTVNPQSVAAVARTPKFTLDDVRTRSTIVVLDHVQDPGNVGAILRACLAFKASAILIESAEVTNPKTVRSAASSILRVPWVALSREEAESILEEIGRPVYRLENRPGAIDVAGASAEPSIIIAGNEGGGISLDIAGQSLRVPQEPGLESLNVAQAVTVALFARYRS